MRGELDRPLARADVVARVMQLHHRVGDVPGVAGCTSSSGGCCSWCGWVHAASCATHMSKCALGLNIARAAALGIFFCTVVVVVVLVVTLLLFTSPK